MSVPQALIPPSGMWRFIHPTSSMVLNMQAKAGTQINSSHLLISSGISNCSLNTVSQISKCKKTKTKPPLFKRELLLPLWQVSVCFLSFRLFLANSRTRSRLHRALERKMDSQHNPNLHWYSQTERPMMYPTHIWNRLEVALG